MVLPLDQNVLLVIQPPTLLHRFPPLAPYAEVIGFETEDQVFRADVDFGFVGHMEFFDADAEGGVGSADVLFIVTLSFFEEFVWGLDGDNGGIIGG